MQPEPLEDVGPEWVAESGGVRRFRRPQQDQQAHSPSARPRTHRSIRCFGLIMLIIPQMGCYQEGVAKDTVGGKDVTAHIFELVPHLGPTIGVLKGPQVYLECCRFGEGRDLEERLPRPDHLLLEGAEQEEAEQSPLVLQRFRTPHQAQR